MEKLKSLTEILEPDVRQKYFARMLPGGQTRPLTLEDFYNRAKEIELHDGVPEDIRSHFQTARHLACAHCDAVQPACGQAALSDCLQNCRRMLPPNMH